MQKFKNHRAVGVAYNAAKNMRGTITPTLLVVHDTAGPLTKHSSANYLRNNSAKTSVHFVTERDGTFQQQVPTNRGANHAGESSYNGQRYCNNFSIGIEIVNPGFMTAINDKESQAWWGDVFDNKEYGIVEIETPEHGRHMWMPYTKDQIATVINLAEGLFGYVDTLQDIQPHWYISPGRKVDTNPLFPLEQIRSRVLGRSDPDDDADIKLADANDGEAGEQWGQVDVGLGALNMRRWPSFNPNIIATIPDGVFVPVIAMGDFSGRSWSKVVFDGKEGWVVSRYLKQAAIR